MRYFFPWPDASRVLILILNKSSFYMKHNHSQQKIVTCKNIQHMSKQTESINQLINQFINYETVSLNFILICMPYIECYYKHYISFFTVVFFYTYISVNTNLPFVWENKLLIISVSWFINACFFHMCMCVTLFGKKNIVFIILLFFHIINNWPIIVYKCTVLNVLLVCNHNHYFQ